jgi:hypothetical protein
MTVSCSLHQPLLALLQTLVACPFAPCGDIAGRTPFGILCAADCALLQCCACAKDSFVPYGSCPMHEAPFIAYATAFQRQQASLLLSTLVQVCVHDVVLCIDTAIGLKRLRRWADDALLHITQHIPIRMCHLVPSPAVGWLV